MFKKRRTRQDDSTQPAKPDRKAKLNVESLEKRVLMSASWVDADTGDVQDGATGNNDLFEGTDGADIADGGNSQDILSGNGGNDILSGGDGDDQLFGGEGNDVLAGNRGQDVLDGGAGHDIADYSTASGSVEIDITRDGEAQDTSADGVDTLTSIEGVIGSAHDDTFSFTSPSDGASYTVDGGGGSNTIDLSGFSSESATFGDGELTVEAEGGGSFTIAYENIDSFEFQDTVIAAADVDVAPIEIPVDAEAPLEITIAGGTVAENAEAGTYVATATGIDLGASDTLAYSMVDDAGGRFEIDAETGVITVAEGAGLNYEADTGHQVTVRATDADGEAVELTVDIDVANVEETFVLSGNSTLNASDGPFENVVINGGYMEIDGDVEIHGDLMVTSAARINGGNISVTGDVTTTDTSYHGTATIVLSGDGAQTISTGDGSGELCNVSIENTSGAVSVEGSLQISGSYSDHGNTVDATGADVRIEGNASIDGTGTQFGDVTINAGYIEVSDLEIDGDLVLENVARINGGNISVTGDVTTTDTSYHGTATIVLSGDGAQTISTGDGSGELCNVSIENTSGAVSVEGSLQISGSYSDHGNAVDATGASVELQGNASVSGTGTRFGDMTINGGYMELGGDIYVEGDLTVQNLAQLNGGTIYVAGEINEVDTNWHGTGDIQPWVRNEAPTDLTFAGGTVPEIASAGTVVGMVAGVDADAGDVLSYSLTDDAEGRFEINATTGEITVAEGADLNHETDDAHTVTVEVTDAAGESIQRELTIDVTDVNEGIDTVEFVNADGVVTGDALTLSYGFEDAPVGSNPTSLEFGNGVSASIEQDSAVRTSTIIHQDDGHGAVAGEGDRFWKIIGGSTTMTFSEPLSEISFHYSDVEGGNVTVTANGRTIDLELNNSNRTDVMTITAEPGESFDEVSFDWGNTANDGVGFDAITVTTASVEPVATIAENAAPGTMVGSVRATDQDAGESFTYRMADDAGGRFTVDSEGAIRVAEGAELDYETAASHEITVEVEDSAGHTKTTTVDVQLSDVNEAPDSLGFSGGSVAENAVAGTVVGTASAADADAGDTLTYSLADDAGGRFEIDGTTGEITVAEGAELDHEAAASHTVRVVATDAGGSTVEGEMSISVGDVNEGPVVASGTVIEAAEGEAVTLGVTAIDQDGDALSYNWRQVSGPTVALDDASSDTPVFQAPDIGTDTELVFEVEVSDGESTATETVTIQLVANEAPELDVTNTMTVREGQPVTLSVEARPAGSVSFDEVAIQSHGGANQDIDLDVSASGDTLHMEGNGWKSIEFPYEVTSDTVLEFQFRSTGEGEIHGIGFDTDGELSPETTFKLMGTQDWGNSAFAGEATDDGEWVTYRIPVGEHFTGDFDRIVFVNDQDAGTPAAVSEFRGVQVYEQGDTTGMDSDLTYEWRQTSGPEVTLDDPSATQPTFVAPDIGQDETITFEVTVSDGDNVVTESVEVRVEANAGPEVDAGDDIVVDEQTEVTLSASITVPEPSALDFDAADINGHGGSGQDIDLEVVTSGETLDLTGNGWKSIPMDVEIGPDTVLEFEFRSDSIGEIHGIGFDTDGALSENHSFQLSGTQNWGNQAAHNYEGNDGDWVTYRIPVGESFTGDFDRIVFINDQDVADPQAHSAFRGVRLTNASDDGSPAVDSDITYTWEQIGGPEVTLSDSAAAQPTFDTPAVGEQTEITFRVTVSDGDNVTTDEVAVTVNPVNEAPESLGFVGGSVSENAEAGTVVGTASATDADVGDVLTYSLADDADGRFEIDGTTGEITVTAGAELDHEAAGSHTVRVVATDAAGATVEGEMSISVGDVNEGPDSLGFVGGSVSENAAAGTVVATASASDVDAGDTLSYSLADDADGRFEIDGTTGEITVAAGAELDHEAAGSHTVRVVATDAAGATVEGEIPITVGDVNEAPEGLLSSGGTVAENAVPGTVVAVMSVQDQDAGDAHSYQLLDDAGGRFEIDSETGEITVTAGAELDHEAAGSHTVRVVATDAAGATVEGEMSISVGDVNEGPDSLGFVGGSVSENAAAGTVVATASASDVDAGDTLSYSLADDADGRFEIDGTTGEITVAAGAELDHEAAGSHTVRVVATDAAGATVEGEMSISVGDVNEGPDSLGFVGGSVSENAAAGTVVATASASDVDAGDTLSYSLADDADGRFEIDGTTGEITVAAGAELDHEAAGSHTVRVVATDAAGATVEGEIPITVGDVNEAPEGLLSSGGTVAENAVPGTVVAVMSVQDQDAGDAHSYQLLDDAGGRFEIDSETGEITLVGQLDHEQADAHTVRVRAVDSAGYVIDSEVEISVADVNEAPTALVFASGGATPEGAAPGTIVGSVGGVDPDAGDSLSYTLANDAGGRFSIDAETGVVTVADGADLDHEASPWHTLVVEATDTDGRSIEQPFVVTIGDVNEAPVSMGVAGGAVAEDAVPGTVVASVSVVDPDLGDTVRYELVDDAGGRFVVDPATGDVAVADGAEFDHETDASVSVAVRATDGAGSTIERAFDIQVDDVNEGPTFGAVEPIVVAQAESVRLDAGAQDPEGDELGYRWTQVGGNPVELSDPGDASPTFTAPNLESAGELVFVVEVTDGEHTSQRTIRVAVEPGDAGFDRENAQSDAGATPAVSMAESMSFGNEDQAETAVVEAGDMGATDAAAEPVPAEGQGQDTGGPALSWLTSEINEITEIARSIEPDDLGPMPEHLDGDPDAAFASIFGGLPMTEQGEQPITEPEELNLKDGVGDGFLGKFFAMLRAGFGVQSRNDEETDIGADRFKR